MLGSDYVGYDMIGLANLIRTRQIGEEELLEFVIERIEEFNPKLNAVNHKFYDRARIQIKHGTAAGPFQGVPFLLKDLGSDYAGTPITNGSQIFKGYVSTFSSAVVDRYVRSGLVIVGRTTSSEMGLGGYTETQLDGPTQNPWKAGYSAGGSSGGAGAVVAARILPAAHGSDAGGSIRVPAGWCGVFGLKPSRGLVPNGPGKGEGLGNFMHHALSVSVRDNAALLDAITSNDSGASYHVRQPSRPLLEEVGIAPGRLRIGFVKDAEGVEMSADARAAIDQTAKLCEKLGHYVEYVKWPVPLEQWWQSQRVVSASDTHFRIASFEAQTKRTVVEGDLDRWTWFSYQAGKSVTAAALLQALAAMQSLTRRFNQSFGNYDVIAAPTACRSAMKLGTIGMLPDLQSIHDYQRQSHPFTSIFNWAGAPAMSVPLFWTSEGLPLGLQFGGAWGRDDVLFRLAGQLEVAVPWSHRRPPTAVG
ncbi:amidase [Bradyrhizobium sp. CCBAU 51627]|uniref:amidase n=1 Tax=Bradyrhizobium sp. CCBAU 51627 TaxID=1325088 RepID=UPI0023064907|nr:amidase [Bradyrhizobium sp. CCBAU 51627]MDA9433594.1 hypothetical protein [Bradyrhizobium sp. CCBAU 51627]